MNSFVITPDLLIPAGKVLLMGALGVTLVQSMRGMHGLTLPLERVVVGFLALLFFKSGSDLLLLLSEKLSFLILGAGHSVDLKTLILRAFQESGASSGRGSSFSVPAVLEQAWRIGVWGIMSAVVDGAFLIASFLLECARDVLWRLLLFIFPIACGLYPVFPKMLTNLVLYAVELSLWFPILSAVEVTTAEVARNAMSRAGSWGLYVVAVEVLAILLILLIPTITHKVLSGALSGDLESQAGLLQTAKKVMIATKSLGAGL